MKFLHYIFILFFGASLHASFYRESVIAPTNPLAVLDPVKRSEIERLTQNLRFFGDLNSRPAQDVYVHYQAIQNLLVWPTSPTTALSWMLFPISPLPTINPNNIGVSDPLGRITPEQLGKLIGVIAEYKEDSESFYIDSLFETNRSIQLQKLYQIFTTVGKVSGFVESHNEKELKKFYRYALVDGVSKYVHRNMSPIDEDLHLSETQQADCAARPYKLVIEAFKKSSSHLLEIPGTEILREPNETYFSEAELERELQKKYGDFSYRGIEKLRIQATVDMLWKSAQSSPDQTLQLLSYYGWRKFGEQISDVILASGAIDVAQKPDLENVLATAYTKADYQELVERAKASEDIDGLMAELNEGQRNLLLYGNARYAQIRFQDYGNVRVDHSGKYLAFANCAEMSLFNLTYLAQLQEQEFSLESNPALLPQGSPLQLFWQELAEEDLGTTATRNSWTQAICRRTGVVYRKGGSERTPWTEGHATAHWAELNPGILNQFRTLFHLAGKSEEAVALTYAGSTEETIEAAALRLSQLLGGKPAAVSFSQLFYDEPADEELSFEIVIKSELKNISGKRDWYGEFDILRNGEPLAVWHVNTDHSYLQLTSKKTNVFALEKSFTNPYVIGQLTDIKYYYDPNSNYQQFIQKLDCLHTPEAFSAFFEHANLTDEKFRQALGRWLIQKNNYSLWPLLYHLSWGITAVEQREIRNLIHECQEYSQSAIWQHSQMQRFVSLNDSIVLENDLFETAYIQYSSSPSSNKFGKLSNDNRCRNLRFVASADPNHLGSYTFPHYIYIDNIINIFSSTNFLQLEAICLGFCEDCNEIKVAQLAKLIPSQVKDIFMDCALSPEHLFTLANNSRHFDVKYTCNLDYWYYHIDGNGDFRQENFVILPEDKKQYAYELLYPFAKAGRSFESPFIELHTDEDLEPVYEKLRIVASLHKQPEFLMIEDGAADF